MACHILGAPNLALKLGSPTSVECMKKEGASDFMFPKKSMIRFDFPARGNMPPVKVFWHDGMTETPEIEGVPKGEYLGEPPIASRRRAPAPAAGRGAAPGAAPAPAPRPASRNTYYQGAVFDYEAFQAVLHDPNPRLPAPDGSLFIGDKGMLTTGTYGENTRLIPVEKMKDYRVPGGASHSLARPLSRLDPRLQRRRPGLLQL